MRGTIMHYLQGEVSVAAECAYPERVFNFCAAHGIRFWDIRWLTPQKFTFRLTRTGWRQLQHTSEALECTFSVQRRHGAPFLLSRMRRRYVLLGGCALCMALAVASSFVIWDFSIEGNQSVPDEVILRALERNDISIGTFAYSIDGADLRNHILLEVPSLSWIAVNVRGCRAYVQVVERHDAPQIVDKRVPTNIVACKSGLVTKVLALEGRAMVLPGSVVLPGQLLISGAVDTTGAEAPSVSTRLLSGMGDVYARTWSELSTKIPAQRQCKAYTGEVHREISVIWGKNRIKIYGNDSSKRNSGYDKITERKKLSLASYTLPLTWVCETCRFYETRATDVSREEAVQRGEELLRGYLSSLLDDKGSITAARCASARQGEGYLVTLSTECLEQIGTAVKIPMN